MNNEKVIAMPASVTYTPEQALWSAMTFAQDDNLSDVLVIGYDADGVLLVRSSRLTVLVPCPKEWPFPASHTGYPPRVPVPPENDEAPF